jgi:hypothetical protein
MKRHWPVEVYWSVQVFKYSRGTYLDLGRRESTRCCIISLLSLLKSSCIQSCDCASFEGYKGRSERKRDRGKKERKCCNHDECKCAWKRNVKLLSRKNVYKRSGNKRLTEMMLKEMTAIQGVNILPSLRQARSCLSVLRGKGATRTFL